MNIRLRSALTWPGSRRGRHLCGPWPWGKRRFGYRELRLRMIRLRMPQGFTLTRRAPGMIFGRGVRMLSADRSLHRPLLRGIYELYGRGENMFQKICGFRGLCIETRILVVGFVYFCCDSGSAILELQPFRGLYVRNTSAEHRGDRT